MYDVWLGSEQSAYDYVARLKAVMEHHGSLQLAVHAATVKLDSNVDCEDEDHNGYRWPNPVTYELVEGVAVITVAGGTETSTTNWTRLCGIPTYQDIRLRMQQAYLDGAARVVMLNLDTEGGMAKGAFGMSEYVAAYDKQAKPIVSFTAGIMASAGVLYGSAARAVLADQYADVGAIGAIAVFLDLSGMLKQEGIKPYVFRSAPYKGKPNSYEGMDDKGKEVLQAYVQKAHDQFVSILSTNLGMPAADINKNIANGKMYSAQEALSLGLIQGIATYEKTLASLNTRYQNSTMSTARAV